MKTLPPQTIGMKWFPKREGMAMGIVVGGFGFGAFVFNQVCCMEEEEEEGRPQNVWP